MTRRISNEVKELAIRIGRPTNRLIELKLVEQNGKIPVERIPHGECIAQVLLLRHLLNQRYS
jgi:hypothetical protein